MIPFSELFDVAFISLFRNKLRAFLTMLGIIIGVSSVILLISIGSGLQGYVTQQFESLGSNLIYILPGEIESAMGGSSMGGTNKLSFRDLQTIKRIGYPIKNASAQITLFATIKYGDKDKNVSTNAMDGVAMDMFNYKAKYGRILADTDIEKSSRVAAIGPNVAKDVFGTENPVGKSFLLESSTYKVIGVWESKGGSGGGVGQNLDDEISIPVTAAQKQFNLTTPNAITVSVYSKDQIETAKTKITNALLKSYEEDEFSVLGQEDLLKTINQILGVISAGLGGIAAISLLVGGIGIMNIMFVTVTERTKEIGLRKALGARPKDILLQFLIESVTLSIVGGSIGITLAMISSAILNRFLSSTVTLSAIMLAFGFSSVIGVIFGVVPSYRAAKMDPIKALRYE